MDGDNNVLSLVQKPLKHYCVYLRDDENWGFVRVRANSYLATDYGTYAFYLENAEEVNRRYMKGNLPDCVYEIPRRNVDAISEESMSEVVIMTSKKNSRQAKAANKKIASQKTSSALKKITK